jgi:acyl-CoA synthetase (NDP forming)
MNTTLETLLAPRSIAIVGASADLKRIGGIPMDLLVRAGFERVYPINPRYPEIAGRRAYPDIESVPEVVDLVLLAIGADDTLPYLERCHARGVRAAVVFAAGFEETGEAQGISRQQQLVEFARRSGMAIAGPNCMGNANLKDGIFTTFGTSFQPGDTVGSTALVTQSGNMCAAIYRMGRRMGVNFSHVINTGNEAVIELADYLRYLAQDESTDAALCYVEALRNGPAFIEASRAFRASGKLLALYKVGASKKGAEAARSHTAALAGDRYAYESVVDMVGAVSATSLSELSDLGYLHRFRQRRFGKRVAIFSVSGAGGAILSDVLYASGADVPTLTQDVQLKLRSIIPAYGMVSNPVDLTGNLANSNDFLLEAMALAAEEDGIDVLIIYLPGSFLDRALPQLATLVERTNKAIVAIDTFAIADRAKVEALGIALFDDFDRAARAIAKYGDWLGKAVSTGAPCSASEGQRTWPQRDDGPLSEIAAKEALAAFGVPVASGRLVRSEAEARAVAATIRGPMVLKLVSPDVQHKSEHGFVRLNVTGAPAAAHHYGEMVAKARTMPGVRVDGVTVEPQLTGGIELLCGCTRDPVFGWMMTVGLGGVWTELMADVSHRMLPVDETQVEAMLRALRGFRLLDGYRGTPKADVPAAARAIAALSRAVLAAQERVREVEVNPLMVLPAGLGAVAVDALVVFR